MFAIFSSPVLIEGHPEHSANFKPVSGLCLTQSIITKCLFKHRVFATLLPDLQQNMMQTCCSFTSTISITKKQQNDANTALQKCEDRKNASN